MRSFLSRLKSVRKSAARTGDKDSATAVCASFEALEPRVLLSAVDGSGIIEYNGNLLTNQSNELPAGVAPYYASINAVRHLTGGSEYNTNPEQFATSHGEDLVNATFEWTIDTDPAAGELGADFVQYQGFTIGHVFEDAGEFKIKLSVTSADGTEFTEYADTVEIVAVSPLTRAQGDLDGTGGIIHDWDELDYAISNLNDNTEIVLAAGEDFTASSPSSGTTFLSIDVDNILIRGENSSG